MKFNSQICTTKEQSQRLLELGLKPETADCYNREEQYGFSNWIGQPSLTTDIPAWSLHRLIDLCGAEHMPISFYKKSKVMIPTHSGRRNYNHYDSLIDCIEWLISEGYFNKEYLIHTHCENG